jgi:hypothetical protein
MATTRALSSVAHNTAHHAASSLSFLHPHACRAAREAGLGELQFDLLNPQLLALSSIAEPLRLASEALRATFIRILEQEGFEPTALRKAVLVMWFPSDEYHCAATCLLETTTGKRFEKSSTSTG